MCSKLSWLCALGFVLLGYASAVAAVREWSDSTGMFKITAELVAVRNGKVILEKPDGAVITVLLEKLSAADQDYLKKLEAPAAPGVPVAPPPAPVNPFAASAPVAPRPVTTQGAELASQAQSILRANCYRCHGEDGASEGGFNFALNLEKLARTMAKPGAARESLLLARMSSKDESVMPPEGESPRPSGADIAVIRAWIDGGSPALATQKPRDFISNETIVKHILNDVRQTTERSRRFLRYFTLTHLYNANVSEDELQTYRNAFTKLINSLSWNKSLITPRALDPERTVFRIDMRELNWTSDIWESIEKSNPYFLAMNTPDAIACNDATQTQMPYVRIDWFVFAASKPPLYHKVLQIPGTDQELEQLLRVNVEANIDQEKAVRAAFNRSGVSQHNRLIEWHQSPYGSYWKSYDFGGSTGRQNLFEHPLGPGTSADSFQHDGGELIFTLPNGMQGYMLVDGAGRRIDQGPTSIVSDPKQADRTVTNGVSCMSCHYAGVIPKTDEIGPVVRANPKAFANASDILALYRKQEELNQILDEDGKRFAAAMKQIGISSISRSGEPISAMALRFQQEIDMPMVAAEFGLTPQDFSQRLDSADSTARAMGPLRISGGTIKRDVFVTLFGRACEELRLVASAPSLFAANRPGAASAAAGGGGIAPAATVRLSDASKPGEVCRFDDMGWGVKSLAFSPVGNVLAAGKMDRAVWIFDVPKKTRLQSFDKLEILDSVECCTFTPTGEHFLAAGRKGHIMIFEVTRDGLMKAAGQFAGHTGEVNSISVSADGKFAVSGGREGKVRYWEIATGQERAMFTGFRGNIKACYMARNGRSAMATDGESLLQFDLMKREVMKQRKLGRTTSGEAAAFSPDGTFVAVANGYQIHLWNLNSTGELPVCDQGDTIWTLTFTPDGNRLLSGGAGVVNIWDFKKQRKIYSQQTSGSYYVQSIATAPDNKHYAAVPSSAGQDLQVFRLPP